MTESTQLYMIDISKDGMTALAELPCHACIKMSLEAVLAASSLLAAESSHL